MRRLFSALALAAALAAVAGCCGCGRDLPVSLEPLNNWLCFHGKSCGQCPRSCPPCPYSCPHDGVYASAETSGAAAQPAAVAKSVDDVGAPFRAETRAQTESSAAKPEPSKTQPDSAGATKDK
jgi:hypothetical protein